MTTATTTSPPPPPKPKTRLKKTKIAAAAVVLATLGTIVGAHIANTCAGVPTFTSGETYTVAPGTAADPTPPIALNCPINLSHLSNVTINGGTWQDPNNSPGSTNGHGTPRGRPAFNLNQSTGITLENLNIAGINTGGYHASLAFNAGIAITGGSGDTISNVHVGHVFGDCLSLLPQRSGKGTNGVVAPVENLTVTNFTGTACGRQGVTCSSVNGATFNGLTIGSTGFDPIDCEADQNGGEGAKNLTINGGSWNGLFAITSGGGATGPITVNQLTMSAAGSGDALLIRNTDNTPDAGPITFNQSTIRCGASKYVACLNLNQANVVMSRDTVTIGFKGDALREAEYHLSSHSTLSLLSTTIGGVFKKGSVDSTSTVTVGTAP